MTPDALNNALNSNEPSSLDPLAILRRGKERSRLEYGSQLIVNRFNSGASAADVIHKAGYFSQGGHKDSQLPALQGTVVPLNLQAQSQISNMGGSKTRGGTNTTLTVNAKDYKIMESENKQLKKDIGKLPQELAQLKENYGKVVEENKNLRITVANLQEQINKMRKKRGRKGTVNRKSEQSEDVKDAIDEYVKGVLFRTVKFAQSGNQLTSATKLVWHGIKDKKKLEVGASPLTGDDFCEIYESHVGTTLSLRRQYVQTQTQKAAEDWMDANHGNLPTTAEMENVWDLPVVTETSSDADKAEYSRKVGILTWYLNGFLPKAVGLEFWGENVRPFNLMTDTALVEGDLSGKKKVLVTVTSEAFGLLVYHNCRDKWVADYKYRQQHGKKASIPKYDKDSPSTHVHVNKWSNSRSGSAVGGGWHVDALKKFNGLKAQIKTFREGETANGNQKMAYGKTLVMAANDITLNGGKLAGQKRKAASKEAEQSPEVVDITFDDE